MKNYLSMRPPKQTLPPALGDAKSYHITVNNEPARRPQSWALYVQWIVTEPRKIAGSSSSIKQVPPDQPGGSLRHGRQAKVENTAMLMGQWLVSLGKPSWACHLSSPDSSGTAW